MSTAITKAGGGFSIAPQNMSELFRFAEMVAESDFAPKDYRGKPGNCLIAMQMGAEVGLAPMQAIQNIAVINGRPSLWGDAMLAVCLPYLDAFDESDDGATATCVAKRGNRTVTQTFSTEDAKRAGLANKQGPWTTNPKRMRQMRARGFALRDICADVLKGVQSAEESQDIPQPKEVRGEVVSSKVAEPEPKALPQQERKSEPPPAAPVTFAQSFPFKEWAGKPLSEAPFETLEDYRCWLEGVLKDGSRRKLHKAAQKALEDVTAEADRRIDAETGEVRDVVADGLQQKIDEQANAPGGVNDEAPSWGLEAPQ